MKLGVIRAAYLRASHARFDTVTRHCRIQNWIANLGGDSSEPISGSPASASHAGKKSKAKVAAPVEERSPVDRLIHQAMEEWGNSGRRA